MLKYSVEEFLLEYDIRGTSKDTMKCYSNALKIFTKFIGEEKEVESINVVYIKEFVKFNKHRGLKIKSQNSHATVIRIL